MNTNDTNKMAAHAMIDHIFEDLLPAQGMAERPEQIRLSHRMLDAMLGGGIALFLLNFVFAGLIGGCVLVWRLLVAAWYVPLTLYRLLTAGCECVVT